MKADTNHTSSSFVFVAAVGCVGMALMAMLLLPY